MISVEFDNIIYSIQKFGGASVYWREMTSRVNASESFNVNFKNTGWWLRGIPAMSKCDIFHSSHFRHCLGRGVRVVTTVHDMNYEMGLMKNGPGSVFNMLERKKSYFKSDAIVCISENTKKELLNIYPSLKNRCPIYVIHHGYTLLPVKELFEIGVSINSQGYILFVGGRNGYKKFITALQAYYESKIWMSSVFLLCTGDEFNEYEHKLISSYGLTKHVICLGKVSEVQLGTLYANALCLIYPSIHEGFGLPILEAMSLKCPVIAADASCIPEIAGGAALLVEPDLIENYVKSIKLLRDSKFRSDIVSRGSERALNFSWDLSAEMHMSVYKNLHKNI